MPSDQRTERLVFRSPLSHIAFLFGPLGAVALGFGFYFAARHQPDAWTGLGLGMLFFGIAILFVLTRRRLVVDLGQRRYRYSRGPLYAARTGSLAEISRVRVHGRRVPDANLEEMIHYAVDLVPNEGDAIGVLDVEDSLEALARGEILARRLRLPLADERDPDAPSIETPAEVDAEVARRLSSGVPRPGSAPDGVVDEDARLLLPPPGFDARAVGLLVGVVLLAVFLVLAHVIAGGRGARVGFGFAAYALPFDLVVGWLSVRLAALLLGSEEILVDTEAVTFARRLGALRLGRARIEIERLAPLAVVESGVRLGCDEKVVDAGHGLDAEGRTWLARRLSWRLAEAAAPAR